MSGKKHIACDMYHLPKNIAPHVDFVTPSIHFDVKLTHHDSTEPARSVGQPGSGNGPKTTGKLNAPLPTDLSTCNEYITLECLHVLYGLEDTPSSTPKNTFGIVEYTPQAYLQSDLDMFFGNFSPSLYRRSPHMISIDGGYVQTEYQGFDYNSESDLDLQYGMGLVRPSQTVTLYQASDMVEGPTQNYRNTYCTFEGGNNPNQDAMYPDMAPGGYEGWFSFKILSHYNLPTPVIKGPLACGTTPLSNVISTLYSYNEADLSVFYTAHQCAEFAKLGLMGITILYSSGDFSVAGYDNVCLNPNGTQSVGSMIFNPTFPATCPYITLVSATMVPPNSMVYEPEMACEEIIYSSGGWSNYFAMPDYQKSAVKYYLANYYPDCPPDIWNSTGKLCAFPDISANGANYVIAVDGEFELVYGTSCSSPVSAAIFTMINDAHLVAGKSTIGFINPMIYTPTFA
ncbi:peptidase S8/S53 domain-containing protein [Chiua virens]|nr:peptidase S8/S53 domain-containing protein [Chiua virens]